MKEDINKTANLALHRGDVTRTIRVCHFAISANIMFLNFYSAGNLNQGGAYHLIRTCDTQMYKEYYNHIFEKSQ